MRKIEFKKFEEIKEQIGWQYSSNKPIGQLWQYNDGFCTNGMGEGFRIHGGTNIQEINKLVDCLNKRDVEIAELQLK